MPDYEYTRDIDQCLVVLQNGGIILFPTDTIWGIGCDATNEGAVEKVLRIKQRKSAQGLITLLADTTEISKYADVVPYPLVQEIASRTKPTTVIYAGGKNVAANVLPLDQTIAIRFIKDDFCRALIQQFGKPVVSTSANIHGRPSPQNFAEVSNDVIRQVEYVVQYRQQEQNLCQPSTILKIKPDGFETIRP